MNTLYIKKISIKKEDIESFEKYPFNIEVVKNFNELNIESSVTFLYGENGTGKSTFIEAIAVACGLNAEGGTQNFHFSTKSTHSELYEYIRIGKFGIPKTKFFLRAESLYNVATEIEELDKELLGGTHIADAYGGDLHECSHGEAFMKVVENKFSGNGLYILDEPEAALSPNRQLSLLCHIDKLVKQGAQFIIATHSPILLSYRDGKIYDLNNNFEEIKYEETEVYTTYKNFLNNPYGMQKMLFDYDKI